MMADIRIIDADSHVNEPADVWQGGCRRGCGIRRRG